MSDPFFSPVRLELNHVQVIVQAMYAVAKADEFHPTELVLIRQFYEACRQDVGGLTDFDDLIRRPFDGAMAKDIVNTPELQEVLLKSCYLVALADGTFSDHEKKAVAAISTEAGIAPDVADRVHELVKDRLIMSISRSAQTETVKKIAGAL